jgi:hypothetical protein
MTFSDTFIEWLTKYVEEGFAEEHRGMVVRRGGSIMMFRTEEDQISEESLNGDIEDQV